MTTSQVNGAARSRDAFRCLHHLPAELWQVSANAPSHIPEREGETEEKREREINSISNFSSSCDHLIKLKVLEVMVSLFWGGVCVCVCGESGGRVQGCSDLCKSDIKNKN